MVERWVSSGSGDAVLRTAAKSPQDCGYADSEGIVTVEKAAEAAANTATMPATICWAGCRTTPYTETPRLV